MAQDCCLSLSHISHINRKVKANTLRRGNQGQKGLLEKITGYCFCVPELQREAVRQVRLWHTVWFSCGRNKGFSHQIRVAVRQYRVEPLVSIKSGIWGYFCHTFVIALVVCLTVCSAKRHRVLRAEVTTLSVVFTSTKPPPACKPTSWPPHTLQ